MEAHCRVLSRIKSRPSRIWLCTSIGRAARLLPRLQDTHLPFVVCPPKASDPGLLAGLAMVVDRSSHAASGKAETFEIARNRAVETYLARNVYTDPTPGVSVLILAGNLNRLLVDRLLSHVALMGPVLACDAFLWDQISHESIFEARTRAIGLHWRDTRADAERAFVQHVARLVKSLPVGSRVVICAATSDKMDGLAECIREAGLLPHLVRGNGSVAAVASAGWVKVLSIHSLPQSCVTAPPAYAFATMMPGGVPLAAFALSMGIKKPGFLADPGERQEARNRWLQSMRETFPDLWIGPGLTVHPVHLARSEPVVDRDADGGAVADDGADSAPPDLASEVA